MPLYRSYLVAMDFDFKGRKLNLFYWKTEPYFDINSSTGQFSKTNRLPFHEPWTRFCERYARKLDHAPGRWGAVRSQREPASQRKSRRSVNYTRPAQLQQPRSSTAAVIAAGRCSPKRDPDRCRGITRRTAAPAGAFHFRRSGRGSAARPRCVASEQV